MRYLNQDIRKIRCYVKISRSSTHSDSSVGISRYSSSHYLQLKKLRFVFLKISVSSCLIKTLTIHIHTENFSVEEKVQRHIWKQLINGIYRQSTCHNSPFTRWIGALKIVCLLISIVIFLCAELKNGKSFY